MVKFGSLLTRWVIDERLKAPASFTGSVTCKRLSFLFLGSSAIKLSVICLIFRQDFRESTNTAILHGLQGNYTAIAMLQHGKQV